MHAGWEGASIVFAYSKICITKHWKHKHYGSLMWFLLSRRRSILFQFENCMKLCLFIINRTERYSLNQICTAIVCTHRKLRRRFYLLPPIILLLLFSCPKRTKPFNNGYFAISSSFQMKYSVEFSVSTEKFFVGSKVPKCVSWYFG